MSLDTNHADMPHAFNAVLDSHATRRFSGRTARELAALAFVMPDADPQEDARPRHIIFTLDKMNYALPLAHLLEITRAPRITPMPFMPAWHTGIANLRGDILSVVDLRILLNMNPAPRTRHERIVVVRSQTDDTTIGFIVDRVHNIRRIDPTQIMSPVTAPKPDRRGTYICGMYDDDDDQLLVVLDVEGLLGSPELSRFQITGVV